MKKVLLLVVVLSSALFTFAQQGSWYIGGVVGYASNTSKDPDDFKTTRSEWAFGPEVGTFLKDDIQLGVFLGLSGNTLKDDDGDIYKASYATPTVYMRKFFKITDSFSTFGGLYLSYVSGTADDYENNIETKISGVAARVGLGLAYSLSPRFTAVGQYGLLGFGSTKNKVDGSDAGSDAYFDFGVNTVGANTLQQGNGSGSVFNIGVYYTFKQ